MANERKVIWYEGMFLQPQHFQQQARYFEYYIAQKQQIIAQNNWGFSQLIINSNALARGCVLLDQAVGIFPDGTPFSIPRNDLVPGNYVVAEGNDFMLYLALPLQQSSVAEAAADEAPHLYRNRVKNVEVVNNNSGQAEASELQLGALYCQILSEYDDLSNYACLPLMRVKEARAQHPLSCDKHFIPPLLTMQENNHLRQFLIEVHGLLSHRAQMLAARLTDSEQAAAAQIADFLLLQIANKYEPLFHYLRQQVFLHPETLYRYCLALLGELATYTRNDRRAPKLAHYNHSDLMATFAVMMKEVRYALTRVLEQNAKKIDLESFDHGRWAALVHDKTLFENASFVLAVYGDLPVENIRAMLPARIKVAPVDQLNTLISRALPGIELSNIAVAPRQIPYHANFSYFALNSENPLWEQVKKTGGIGIHVSVPIPGLTIELWSIKG